MTAKFLHWIQMQLFEDRTHLQHMTCLPLLLIPLNQEVIATSVGIMKCLVHQCVVFVSVSTRVNVALVINMQPVATTGGILAMQLIQSRLLLTHNPRKYTHQPF